MSELITINQYSASVKQILNNCHTMYPLRLINVTDIRDKNIKNVDELKVSINWKHLVAVSSDNVLQHLGVLKAYSDGTDATGSTGWEELTSDGNGVISEVGSTITEEDDLVGILSPRAELTDTETEAYSDENTRGTGEAGMIDIEEEGIGITDEITDGHVTEAILDGGISGIGIDGDNRRDELNEILLCAVVSQ